VAWRAQRNARHRASYIAIGEKHSSVAAENGGGSSAAYSGADSG